MNNQYYLDQILLLLYYIPGKSEFIFPGLLLDLYIYTYMYTSKSAEVLWRPLVTAMRDGRPRIDQQFIGLSLFPHS